ncbi:MAG: hypothetical protein FWC43_12810 [Planctomycetaceae bacterium]|nr:hypothetical protein [Planctomycetaceae bacterium]
MKCTALSTLFFLVLGTATSFAATDVPPSPWSPVEGKILSIFAKDVNSKNPHPEYPRPQLVRKQWVNLNGLWDYAITGENDVQPENFDGKILVPFAIESALSGVGKKVGPDNRLWYKRTFTVPADWQGKRIRLNFGAVDWDSTVFVNGKKIGNHKGGYSPFSYDITDALTESGEQTLIVSVWDPTDLRGGTQPRGKQHSNPHGIWYTAVTGIWQTVWIEPVAETFIQKIKAVANLEDSTVTFNFDIPGVQDGDKIEATVLSAGNRGLVRNRSVATPIAGKKEAAGSPLVVKIKNPNLWTPDSPFLYDVKFQLLRDGKAIDTVDSYFAMRDIKLGKCDKGITRILLNGKFLFQHGPLDQGWWPDGLYTAPTDKALEYDVIRTKDFGFNMLRKHVKVEPDRFYYHCDRLGMLVWQDMPSGDKYIGPKDDDAERTPESEAQFRAELKEMIHSLDNHPCIVIWVPFNEGWGQFKTGEIVNYCRELDSTRLVNSASGWTERGVGDMHDIHIYPGPAMPPVEENRAIVLGEYGGLGMPIKGHTWQDDKNWGYQSFDEKEALFKRYDQLNRALHPMIAKGLSAAVYTQTTDVEIEVNGLMTYDRAVDKFDAKRLKASNNGLRSAPPTVKTIIPTAKEEASVWKYTTEKPADNWNQADFDDSGWKEGESGFGTKTTPNTTVRTEWNTSDIWIRKTIELDADTVRAADKLVLNLYHDEDCEVFINGVQVFAAKGFITTYTTKEMNVGDLRKALKVGANTIAISCKQTTGGQYIDAGLLQVIPPANPGKRLW